MIGINSIIYNYIHNFMLYFILVGLSLFLYYLIDRYYNLFIRVQNKYPENQSSFFFSSGTVTPTIPDNNNSPKVPEDPVTKLLRKWREFKRGLQKHIDKYSWFYTPAFYTIILGIVFFIISEAVVKHYVQEEYVCSIVRNIVAGVGQLPLSLKASLIAIKDSCGNDFFFFNRFIDMSTALDNRSNPIKTKFLIEVISIYVEKWNLYEDPRRHDLFIRMALSYCLKHGLAYSSEDLTLLVDHIDKLNDLIDGTN